MLVNEAQHLYPFEQIVTGRPRTDIGNRLLFSLRNPGGGYFNAVYLYDAEQLLGNQ